MGDKYRLLHECVQISLCNQDCDQKVCVLNKTLYLLLLLSNYFKNKINNNKKMTFRSCGRDEWVCALRKVASGKFLANKREQSVIAVWNRQGFELVRGHSKHKKMTFRSCGRDEWTRTTDPHLIRVVL